MASEVVVSEERATVPVLVKFTPSELAAVDRARGLEKRTVFIKRYLAAVARRVNGEVDDGKA